MRVHVNVTTFSGAEVQCPIQRSLPNSLAYLTHGAKTHGAKMTDRRVLNDRRSGFDRRVPDELCGRPLESPISEGVDRHVRTFEPRRQVIRRADRGPDGLLEQLRRRFYPTPRPPDPFDLLLAEATRRGILRALDFGAGRGARRPRFTPGSVLLVGCDPTDAVSENVTLD